MSLLLRDEVQVVLSPSQVLLARAGWACARRRRLLGQRTVECARAEPGQLPWSAALATLGQQLPARRARAQVTLSNQFVRYALIPWQAGLRGEDEQAAYARHCFSAQFGSGAEGWDIRVSGAAPGLARLASAVDTQLLAALRQVASASAVRPQLMSTFNRYRRLLGAGSAWLVLAESGCLCLALFAAGEWRAVRTLNAGPGWQDALPALLEREACLADADAEQVYLWTPGREPEPRAGSRRIHPLLAPAAAESDAWYAARFGIGEGA